MRSCSALAAGCCAALLASSDAFAQPRSWNFEVFLDDARIGHHSFTLSDRDVGREMKIDAHFDVKVLFVNVYRYSHDADERWRGDCLSSLSSHTDDDGKRLSVEAVREGDHLVITSQRGRENGDGCVMSYAYWNPEILHKSRLLNAQTGALDLIQVSALGEEDIQVRGIATRASHYRISGPARPIDLWYSAGQEWLALESTVAGGRRLRYRLQ